MKSSSRAVPLLASLLLLTLGAGCARAKSAPASEQAHEAPAAAAVAPAAPPVAASAAVGGGMPGGPADAKPQAATRALVVTIDLTVSTARPDVLAERLRADVERAGGFVADATTTGFGEQRTHRLVLRVPKTETRSLRATIADYGKIASDTEKSEDVTEQHADLTARLANARTQEKRLVEIMAQRTGSVAEVLEVERELARVRETIERLDAQKRGLDGKIDLATVTITIGTPLTAPPPPVEESAGTRIVEAFHDGVKASGTLLLWLAMAAAASSPILVPLLLVVGGIVYAVRRRRALRVARYSGP